MKLTGKKDLLAIQNKALCDIDEAYHKWLLDNIPKSTFMYIYSDKVKEAKETLEKGYAPNTNYYVMSKDDAVSILEKDKELKDKLSHIEGYRLSFKDTIRHSQHETDIKTIVAMFLKLLI